MRTKNIWVDIIALAIIAVGAYYYFAGSNGKPGGASKRGTLVMGYTPWSTTPPPSWITRLLLEQLGYNVTMQSADVGVVYAGIAQGDVDVFMDGWPLLHKTYLDKYGDKLVQAGRIYTDVKMGWITPDYVPINSMLDLTKPDIKAKLDLNGNGKPEIYGIDPGSGMMNTSRSKVIPQYGLSDYELIASGEPAMITQLKRAIDKKNWIVTLGWKPHWIFVTMKLKFLDDPKHIWPDPKKAGTASFVRQGLSDDDPVAYTLIKQVHLQVDDMDNMIKEIAIDHREPKDVAQAWIDAHKSEVDGWLAKARAAG